MFGDKSPASSNRFAKPASSEVAIARRARAPTHARPSSRIGRRRAHGVPRFRRVRPRSLALLRHPGPTSQSGLGFGAPEMRRDEERPCAAAARENCERAFRSGERLDDRNAQATVLAPTGTSGLLMDCDTTRIEADFALVKFEEFTGGRPSRSSIRAFPRRSRTGPTMGANRRGCRLRPRDEHVRGRAASLARPRPLTPSARLRRSLRSDP